MKVPFVDLRAMHEEVRPEIEAAFQDVFNKSSFIGGPYLNAFEQNFAAYCGVKQAVTCASGTDAVKLALLAAGVHAGDAVMTVAHTFIASVEAITLVGALPIFIDIAADTYHMSAAAVEQYFQETCRLGADGYWVDGRSGLRITALLPVHLYGMVADMQALLEVAARYQLAVVEDACQAHGARYSLDGVKKRAGSFGSAGAFSFYPGKNLGAMGEGGAVTTNDEGSAARLRMLRDHGSYQKYIHVSPEGWNGRLDTLQCAILDIKLKKLEVWNSKRQQVAAWYNERLAGDERISTPVVPQGRDHVYHLYIVRVPERDRVLKELAAREIGCGLHYPIPLHLQTAYRDLGYLEGDLPVTEAMAAAILTLPMFPHMSEEMVDYTCSQLKELF